MTMQPDVVERLDHNQVRASVRNLIQRYLPSWQPRPAGDSRYQAALAHADAVYALRVYLNLRGKAQTISGATDADLDDWGTFFDVPRNGRLDDDYRQAIIDSNRASKPGTKAYLGAVITGTSVNIFDWSYLTHDPDNTSTTPAAGTIRVYILSSDSGGNLFGTPNAALRTTVQTALNSDDEPNPKLISDTYEVLAPTITRYRVEVDATGGVNNTIASRLRGFAQTLTRLGRGITVAEYIAATLSYGASNATVTLKQGDGTALAGGAVDLAPVANAAYAVRDSDITVT